MSRSMCLGNPNRSVMSIEAFAKNIWSVTTSYIPIGIHQSLMMASHNKPKKPVRNPVVYVLPKKGPGYPKEEQMPRVQEELELTVGKKFVGALKHFKGIELHDLHHGPEPADLICQTAEGDQIAIQVVEVVDLQLRQVDDMRASYRNALVKTLDKNLLLYNGCRVTLCDSGEPPYLPKVSTPQGQVCLMRIAHSILEMAKGVDTLDIGGYKGIRVKIFNPKRSISIGVERVIPAADPVRLEFTWTGGGPAYYSDKSRGLLTRAVQTKLAKHYVKPNIGKFILLLYSIDFSLEMDELDLRDARQLLNSAKHPFDDVWFIYLYPQEELGALTLIWPLKDKEIMIV